MKLLVFVVCVFLIKNGVFGAMTDAQVKSAGKLLKNVCQPKSKITNDQINEFHQGNFNPAPETKVYMECVLRSAQVMKDGKIVTGETIMNQMKNLPAEKSDRVIASYQHCVGTTGSDKFELAYEYYKCFYEHDPEVFFLP